jgi:hypothetical protein
VGRGTAIWICGCVDCACGALFGISEKSVTPMAALASAMSPLCAFGLMGMTAASAAAWAYRGINSAVCPSSRLLKKPLQNRSSLV